jgi:hypothetical protein
MMEEEEAEVVVVGFGTLDTVPWFFVASRTNKGRETRSRAGSNQRATPLVMSGQMMHIYVHLMYVL